MRQAERAGDGNQGEAAFEQQQRSFALRSVGQEHIANFML